MSEQILALLIIAGGVAQTLAHHQDLGQSLIMAGLAMWQRDSRSSNLRP